MILKNDRIRKSQFSFSANIEKWMGKGNGIGGERGGGGGRARREIPFSVKRTLECDEVRKGSKKKCDERPERGLLIT